MKQNCKRPVDYQANFKQEGGAKKKHNTKVYKKIYAEMRIFKEKHGTWYT